MKCYCKACGHDVQVPHRRGTKQWFKFWRSHYAKKHGGYKRKVKKVNPRSTKKDRDFIKAFKAFLEEWE